MTLLPSEPPRKKRKLPSLDDSFSSDSRPSDRPELHQGRKRTQPHLEGQWAAHIYLEFEMEPLLRRTIQQAISTQQRSNLQNVLHSFFDRAEPDNGSTTAHQSLHVSLTRPLYLQTNQKADLRTAVAKVASLFPGFSAKYASFGMLENDEKTRRFLAIEIGQGYEQLKNLVRELDFELELLRLPVYYENPRFHTSIAWTTPESGHFSSSELEQLDKAFGKNLRLDELWIGELVLKIGKDVHRYPLSAR
ncbi:HVSL domain-containing protein [Sporobolomyces koalae]|uniref:HVSL domain-containing protein n=1 Tax=Sporobolomyces koalae TaxID=500713 RepID=UPI00318087E9